MITQKTIDKNIDKRKLRGEKTRRKILLAARDLFASQGYHATTTRQITDRAGITRGAIYNHFESKEAIFQAVLMVYHPWKYIPAAVEMAEGDTIDDFVHDAARRMLVIWDENQQDILLHLIEIIEFQGRHLPKLFESAFIRMTEIIRKLNRKRINIDSFSVPALSRALLGLFFAYLMSEQFTGIPLQSGLEQDNFSYYTDVYLQGVLAREMRTGRKREKT